MNKKHESAIGFLGGTFDPIHFGHLRPALEIQEALQLQSLYLMPNYIAPHKATSLASTEQRIEMVKLAIQDTPSLQMDTQELLRNSPSYTVETLALLRAQYPNTPICFIMGMDSLINFHTWYRYQDILQYCHLVVSHRPGWSPQFNETVSTILAKHQTQDTTDLHSSLNGCIYFQSTTQLDISSSQIRKLCANNQGIEFLTPTPVCHYIKEQNCYQLK
ncbi:nicotinate-nucleotide adenylyltransferase [Psychromonas sp. 14N.309.X.WAT.B.A12]|uniref:nicotinate-nucleotide adenylyltransferase n=1 Tax=unclassified Psychromonas TaxID=2614957 RepID=UPI0025B220D7|nr:nicotinate-nucleotide adenylyltransferase [Psychromonas sp. 14N.309.X.WAT.B.A12]MDN2662398.1 nicotinate-nucleotide adenylyltransferase [Psychromonas sp. 14N.309.X.WAT.B.A12]